MKSLALLGGYYLAIIVNKSKEVIRPSICNSPLQPTSTLPTLALYLVKCKLGICILSGIYWYGVDSLKFLIEFDMFIDYVHSSMK